MKNNCIRVCLLLSALFVSTLLVTAQLQNIRLELTDNYGNPVGYAGVKKLNGNKDVDIVSADGSLLFMAEMGDYVEIQTFDLKHKVVQVTDTVMHVVVSDKDIKTSAGKNFNVPDREKTAAISTISGDEIRKSSELNLANTLYGLAPGLTVMQNGGAEWGNDPTFYIRGLGGLGGNSDVLILVDGFERPLSSIVKEDVESVQVLKDAAATSIYGLRGINGVILVTTKKGIYEKTEISFSYDHASTRPVRLPQFVDGYTYAMAANEARLNDGNGDPVYNDYALERFRTGDSPYLYPNVNWVDEVFRNYGASNQYNVSLRGGGSKARYYGSLNLMDNTGFLKPEPIMDDYMSQMKYSKMNARINLDINITPTTEFVVRMNGILSERNIPSGGVSDMLGYLYTIPAVAFPVHTESDEWGGSTIWRQNPVAQVAALGNTVNHSRSLSSDAELRQRLDIFLDGLSFGVKVGYDNFAELYDATTRSYAYEIASIEGVNPDGSPSYVAKTKEGKNEAHAFSNGVNNQWRTFNLESAFYYNQIWGKSKLDANLIYSLDNFVGQGQNNVVNRMHYGLSAHYGYMDRYFVGGVFAISGSNQLPPKNKYAYLPGISAGWIASEEDFLKGSSAIDFLKVRASWGVTGRDYRPEANMYRQTFGGGSGYMFESGETSSSGMRENRYPSLNLTYEKSYKTNLGVDLNLFKRLEITADVFMENRRDILVQNYGTISTLLGQDLPYSNVGAVDNKGVEFGAYYTEKLGDFKYRLGGNFSFSRSNVIESGQKFWPDEYSREKGRPVGQIFGYEAVGYYTKDDFDAEGNLLSSLPVNALYSDLKPGDVKLLDKNGDKVINEYDITYIGHNSYFPEIYYSGTFNVEYKGVGIDALIQGVGNYTIVMDQGGMYRPLYGNRTISQHYYDNRWTETTPDALFPRLTLIDNNDNNRAMSTVWIKDGAFAKLRHAEIYYKFNSPKLYGLVGIKDLKVYLRGMDLFTFSKVKEINPEVSGAGYPTSSSFNVGCKLNF